MSRKDPAQDGRYAHALTRTLLHAFYWVDDGLQSYMREHAGISLPRAQSMLMVCIGDGVHRQSEMAKLLRVSKQAVRQAVKELVAKDLVYIEQDPRHGRRKLVQFTDKGKAMREVARQGVLSIEKELAQRIGRDRVGLLHDILEAQWGHAPVYGDDAESSRPDASSG